MFYTINQFQLRTLSILIFLFYLSATSGKRGEDVSVNEPENYEAAHNQSQKMIEITAFQPSFTVPMKPASATSVPQKSVIHTENYAETYDSKGMLLSIKFHLHIFIIFPLTKWTSYF